MRVHCVQCAGVHITRLLPDGWNAKHSAVRVSHGCVLELKPGLRGVQSRHANAGVHTLLLAYLAKGLSERSRAFALRRRHIWRVRG